jgi:prevent-host-death family protein
MKTYNIYEAKTNLSKLLERVAAGESVVIAKAGKPIADLTPHKSKNTIKFGVATKNFVYDDAVLEGIDPEIQAMFYGKNWDK